MEEESGGGKVEKPKRRFIDEMKRKKITHIKTSFISSNKKIRIQKPIKERFFLLITCLILFSIALVYLVIINSSLFKIIKIAYLSKDESIIIGFQNSAELRPTGGFWGSFAILQTKQLSNPELIFETNPYKKDNPLLKETNVELPSPMRETWQDRPQSFVNANWSFDFVEAAKTLEWYFGQGWDRKSDGVIAISSLSMIDLLKIIGPVKLSDNSIIESANFSEVMSNKIDTEYWQKHENKIINEPKTIIKEIAPEIISQAKKANKLKLVLFGIDQVRKGRIIAYSNDPQKQLIIESLKLSGKPIPYSTDYLSVNNANLNGGKSSLNVQQNIDYEITTSIKTQGEIRISRALNNEWPNIMNRNYTRVIVPLGSVLISARQDTKDIFEEVEVKDESGRTTFGFWNSVEPGKRLSSVLRYELPFGKKDEGSYNLVVQKQPGTLSDDLSVRINQKVRFNGKLDKMSLLIR